MAAARAQGVAAILCSSLQPCVPPSVRAKRQEPLVPATAPSLPAWEFPSHMGAIGGVDAALLPTNQDPAPMAGSAVSCRPHPRQEPSALTRTLGSVRRGAGQPALLPRRQRGKLRVNRVGFRPRGQQRNWRDPPAFQSWRSSQGDFQAELLSILLDERDGIHGGYAGNPECSLEVRAASEIQVLVRKSGRAIFS